MGAQYSRPGPDECGGTTPARDRDRPQGDRDVRCPGEVRGSCRSTRSSRGKTSTLLPGSLNSGSLYDGRTSLSRHNSVGTTLLSPPSPEGGTGVVDPEVLGRTSGVGDRWSVLHFPRTSFGVLLRSEVGPDGGGRSRDPWTTLSLGGSPFRPGFVSESLSGKGKSRVGVLPRRSQTDPRENSFTLLSTPLLDSSLLWSLTPDRSQGLKRRGFLPQARLL